MVARRIRIAIGALAMLLILIGVWAALRHHARPFAGASRNSPIKDQTWDGAAAKRAETSSKATKVSSLWVRPSAGLAAHNYRRQGFAWILTQLGANERLLNQLVDGNVVAALTEIKARAQAGDPSAINILGEIAHQQCHLGRDATVLDGYEASQIALAKGLPAYDAEWIDAALSEDVAYDKKVKAACNDVVDVDQALQWVESLAKRGDGASLWLLSMSSSNLAESQRLLREAAASGFPEAQFELAWAIIGGQQGAAGAGVDAVNAGELLRQAADQLPRADAELAICEYTGCGGVAVDVDAAIQHAREAAQRGAIDAMLAIGPHLSAGQVDPNEVMAWGLVQASLLQQGCGNNGFGVREMKSTLSALNANNITAQARALAEQYWTDHGAQIIANLGCGS